MPIEYRIFPEQGLVVERFLGRITVEELEQVTKQIWADDAYENTFNGLFDLTNAELDMSRNEVLAFCQMIFSAPSATSGRVAIIVNKPVETALSFLFQSDLAVKNEVAVFSTWDSVRAFFELPEEVTAQLSGKTG